MFQKQSTSEDALYQLHLWDDGATPIEELQEVEGIVPVPGVPAPLLLAGLVQLSLPGFEEGSEE